MNFDASKLKDPSFFAENRVAAHSDHAAYANLDELAQGESSLRMSLNGLWKFHHARNAGQVIPGFEAAAYDCTGWADIRVPAHIQMEGYGAPKYANMQYPWDGCQQVEIGEIPQEFNPVACYIKTFYLPEGMADKRVFVSFQGAESCIALWCNGQYVGFASDSLTPSEFELTPYLTAGENRLSCRVERWSAGSWLEDQDFIRFSGIFRDVYLYAIPAAHVADLRVKTLMDVTVDPNIYCGKCHYCQIGKKQLCTNLYAIGVNRNGGFAQYCAAPETQCYRLNPDVPLVYGAMTEPLACCIHGMDRLNLRMGDTVCVIGGGAIGLLMLQLAKLSGASKVIVSEPVAMRRKIAEQLGADLTVDPVNENLAERIESYLGVPGVDAVIECVGNTIAVRQAFEAAKRGTTVLLFSVPKPDTTHPLDLMAVYQKELTVMGSMINPDTHARAAALINSGRIRLQEIITHSYPLPQLKDAILMQMSNESLKVVLEPNKDE